MLYFIGLNFDHMPKTRRILVIGIILILVAMGVAIWFVLRNNKDDTNSTAYGNTNVNQSVNATTLPLIQAERLAASPTAKIETTYGTITMRFFTAEAPELSKNFIELAKRGYYNGLTFHRIVPGFVIQGGDPNGDGTGGTSYTGEGMADEAGALALKHVRGAVAWAKSSLPNSIGSQFYIVIDDASYLNNQYSVFGQVVEGMDVVDRISAVSTDGNDKPRVPVRMTSVTVEE